MPAMTESTPKKTSRDAVLDQLVAAFPVFRDAKPLAIGIHKAIREKLPELTRDQVGKALRIHTASTRYLKALAKAEQRFDLDGNPAGEVTEEQRKQAAGVMKERIQKSVERRKAEEQAKLQQEKLAKLAEKFNSR
jgi:ProP effector